MVLFQGNLDTRNFQSGNAVSFIGLAHAQLLSDKLTMLQAGFPRTPTTVCIAIFFPTGLDLYPQIHGGDSVLYNVILPALAYSVLPLPSSHCCQTSG